jgi:small subunit ribosomal protein S7
MFIFNFHRIISFHPERAMSQYPTSYIDPVYKKDKQDQLIESGEYKNLVHLPVRAALSNHSSSVFHDDRVIKFVNYIMIQGKKELARELMNKTFENIKRIQLAKYNKAVDEEEKSKIETNPVTILHTAIENSRPRLYVNAIRRGGVKYQVPVPITEKHSYFRACKWLVEAAREKGTRDKLPDVLAKELLDAANNVGRVIKRKQDLHKLCEANRAYAHYRWS